MGISSLKIGKISYTQLYFQQSIFAITEEIFARSLANFHGQKGDRHVNVYLWDASTRESVQFVIAKKKNEVRFSCVFPVIDNEFRHSFVKEECRSILSPSGSTATLTML